MSYQQQPPVPTSTQAAPPPDTQAPPYQPAQVQAYPAQMLPQQADPGKSMGIIGLVLAFFGPLAVVGLILSIIARSKSHKAGAKNTPALVGIIVSAVVIVVTVVSVVLIATTLSHVVSVCNDYGPGEWLVNGVTYTCS